MIMNNWLKLGSYIHHWSMAYLGMLQIIAVQYLTLILDFGYFDLVKLVDRVNHVSQGSDSKIQHGLDLFKTCPGPILQFQFWEFGPSSPEKVIIIT